MTETTFDLQFCIVMVRSSYHPIKLISFSSYFTHITAVYHPWRLKHGIGADFFSCYIYATEELCLKRTLSKSYAKRHCQILFARKFQAANIACFGDMVFNVLPKWPFISVCCLILKIKSFKVRIMHVSCLNIDIELFA